MDVLKEIAQAEGRAREIEQEFRQKAEALAAASKGRVAGAREQAAKALETGLAALRAELATSLEMEKKKVTEAGREAQERLERQVKENAARAAAIIMKRVGL
jgi:F0F1-type ATP synthase membrane subunit b/b'